MATQTTERTVKSWLTDMANSTSSNGQDAKTMANLLHKCGFPQAIVTCGIVYLEGKGSADMPPMSIKRIAKEILTRQPK